MQMRIQWHRAWIARRRLCDRRALVLGWVAAACLLAAGGCATKHYDPSPKADGRARYRQILCAVLEDRTRADRPVPQCESVLRHREDEPPGTAAPVELSASRAAVTVLYVAGLWSDCAGGPARATFEIKDYLARFGYHFVPVDVSGVASSAWNARRIRDALLRVADSEGDPHIVIVAHSKGVPDTLEALERYPRARRHVDAVISVAGAVGGSPLADPPPVALLHLTSLLPGVACRAGDQQAIASLQRGTRRKWLERHPLHAEVGYYSLVAMPQPSRVSLGLRLPYELLSGLEPGNDGNVLVSDQMVPGSTLLGYLNADHWAVGIDMSESPYAPVRAAADVSDFPRAQVLEAALRFVEEDLGLERPADEAQPRIRED
jgi:hypothetical protein